jgi:hypothetical protein
MLSCTTLILSSCGSTTNVPNSPPTTPTQPTPPTGGPANPGYLNIIGTWTGARAKDGLNTTITISSIDNCRKDKFDDIVCQANGSATFDYVNDACDLSYSLSEGTLSPSQSNKSITSYYITKLEGKLFKSMAIDFSQTYTQAAISSGNTKADGSSCSASGSSLYKLLKQ